MKAFVVTQNRGIGFGETGINERFWYPSFDIKSSFCIWNWDVGEICMQICGFTCGFETKLLADASDRTNRFWG